MEERRLKLEAWRQKRQMATASRVVSSSRSVARPAPSGPPSRKRQEQKQQQPQPQQKRDLVKRTGLAVAVKPAPSHVTPSKEATVDENTRQGNGGQSSRMKVSEIRAKLQQSTKKRKVALSERVKAKSGRSHTASAKPLGKPGLLASVAPNTASKKTRGLVTLVMSQIEVVDNMIECGKYDDARAFLGELRNDVPDCIEVGAFWLRLASIEIKVGNTTRATHVYAHALRHCAEKSLLLACSEFMVSEVLLGSLETLDVLMKAPFSKQDANANEEGQLFDAMEDETGQDDGEQKLKQKQVQGLEPTTDAESKPEQEPGQEQNVEKDGQEAQPSVSTPEQQSKAYQHDNDKMNIDEEDARHSSSVTTDNKGNQNGQQNNTSEDLSAYLCFNPNTTAKKPPAKKIGTAMRVPLPNLASASKPVPNGPETPSTGSFVAFAAVKNRGTQSKALGSAMSMTPVRRSARLVRNPGSVSASKSDLLQQTGFAYTPNPHLRPDGPRSTAKSAAAGGGVAMIEEEDMLV